MNKPQKEMSRTSLILHILRDMGNQFNAHIRQVKEEIDTCQSLSAYADIIVKVIKTDAAFNAQACVLLTELIELNEATGLQPEAERARQWVNRAYRCKYFDSWHSNAMSEIKYDIEVEMRELYVRKFLQSDRAISMVLSIPGVLEPVSENA